MTELACRKISVCLDGHRLLSDVSLQLKPGELLGIVGANGAGKSTLMRALVGLHKLQSGRVDLGGQALPSWGANARARVLAYLPQGHMVHWPQPCRDLVALGRLPYGDAQRPSGMAAIDHALQATETQDFAHAIVQTLSGGERARVLLARVLAGEPDVLLADEPLAALDPAQQLRMMGLLRSRAQSGRAIAVVLHDLTLAARYCSRVLVLHKGRVLADGVPAQVLNNSQLAHAFGVEALHMTHEGETCILPWRLAASLPI